MNPKVVHKTLYDLEPAKSLPYFFPHSLLHNLYFRLSTLKNSLAGSFSLVTTAQMQKIPQNSIFSPFSESYSMSIFS